MCILKQVWLFVDFIRSDFECLVYYTDFFHFCFQVYKTLLVQSSILHLLHPPPAQGWNILLQMQKNLFSAILCVCFSISSVSLIWSGYCLCNFSSSHNDKEVMRCHHIGHIPMSSSCPRPKARAGYSPNVDWFTLWCTHTHQRHHLLPADELYYTGLWRTPQFNSTPLFSSRHKVSTWNKSFPSSKRDT